jgi:hypothetical protein
LVRDTKTRDNFRVFFDQWPKLHLGLDAIKTNLKWYLVYTFAKNMLKAKIAECTKHPLEANV